MLEKSAEGVLFVFDPTGRAFQNVFVAGSFNGWSISEDQLSRGDDGRWRLRRVLPPGRHEYKFVADGQWLSDAAADGQVRNQHGGENSLAVVPELSATPAAVDVSAAVEPSASPSVPPTAAEPSASPSTPSTAASAAPPPPRPMIPRAQYTGFTRARQQRIYLKKVEPTVLAGSPEPAESATATAAPTVSEPAPTEPAPLAATGN